jgi:uncharacterized protein DUF5667
VVTSRDYIADILEICLERMRAGDSVAACLQDYPHCADELAPLLKTADYARRVPPPQLSPAARQAIQRQLRSAVVGRAPRRRATTSWYRTPVLRFSALLLAIVLAIGGGAVGVAAAQSSLPGSPLYSVKRAGEDVRLTLTTRPDQRAMLHMEFAQERLAEILALLDSRQPADEQVLDDLASEYELAWANIQLLPAGQAQAHRERFIAEGHIEVAALTEALRRAPHTNRPAIEAALRSNQATLSLATEKERPTPPKPPAGADPSTPGQNAPPENNQGGRPAPTKSPAVNPGNGQGNGNGNGQPANPGNGQGNGDDHPSPSPAHPPSEPGNSNSNGNNGNGNGQGNGQGQSQEPGNGNGNGQSQEPGNGNGNGNGQGQEPGNGNGNGNGNDSASPDTPVNQPDKSDQNGSNESSQNNNSKNNDKDKAPKNGKP